MKTTSLKQKEISKEWILINAEGAVLGRLASYVSILLRGKHKPNYTPHMDCGDNVVIINASKVKLKGKKLKQKTYYRHTGYPGGIKSRTAEDILYSKQPENLLKMAIKRMLSNNKLARKQLSNLKVFAEENHSLVAQKPREINFLSMNRKNG